MEDARRTRLEMSARLGNWLQLHGANSSCRRPLPRKTVRDLRLVLHPRDGCWRGRAAREQRLVAFVSAGAGTACLERTARASFGENCATRMRQNPKLYSLSKRGLSLTRSVASWLASNRGRASASGTLLVALCASDNEKQRSSAQTNPRATTNPVPTRGAGEEKRTLDAKSVSEAALEQFEGQRGPSTPVVAAAFVAAYLTVGTLFYTTVESWSPLDALYFVVQAGLNVGYGDIQPTKEISRLFTAGFVLAGNLLLGGALALFVQGALMKQERLIQQFAEESNRSQARADESSEEDWDAKSNSGMTGWVMSLFGDAISLTKGVRKVLTSYAKRARRRISDAAENAMNSANGTFGEEPRGVALLVRDLSTVGMAFLNSPLGNVISSYSVLWVWIGTGTLFGIVHEHLPFSDALLFSVSSLSTLGISPPPSSDPVSRLFCTLFLLSGVAVYALTLGRVANFFVDRYEREQVRRLVASRLRLRARWQRAAPRCDIHGNAAAMAWKAQMRQEHAELLESSLHAFPVEPKWNSRSPSTPIPSSKENGNRDPNSDEASLTWSEFLEWKLLAEGRISIERLAAIRQEFEECFEHM